MLLADQIDFTFRNPLLGPRLPGESPLPALAASYDRELRTLGVETGLASGIAVSEGVYAGVVGPCYETPAEVEMRRRLGADAVGISTVHEVLIARARQIRVLGLSVVTNWAAGRARGRLTHQGVLRAATAVAGVLESVVRRLLERLAW